MLKEVLMACAIIQGRGEHLDNGNVPRALRSESQFDKKEKALRLNSAHRSAYVWSVR